MTRAPDNSEAIAATTEIIWQKCEVLIEEAANQGSHFREQGAVLLRWSVTTCLTINAGALVASLNAIEFDPQSRLWSGIWLLIGALLALIVSAILASAFLKIAHTKSLLAKDIKLALRLRDLEKLETLDATKIRDGEALGGFGFLLSVLSVISFVIGAGIMIEGAQ
ncbi:hypothetical protein [Qipengyuania sp. Mu-71]|jgi:hypothetical protein|uniref:hypothetical protein n=1 Tax=Qipengyuania sp. Mu-71 TaxID=3121477 RepID=UPI002FE48A59